MSRGFQAGLIFFLLTIQPVSGLLYYYFKVSGIELVNLILYILVAFILVFQKTNKFLLLSFFITLLLLSTFVRLFSEGSLFDFDSFIKQTILVISFVSILVFGYKINMYRAFQNNEKLIYLFVILDLLIIIFFKINPFGFSVYGSFESAYLIPTYIYSLVTLNPLLISLHLLSIILHDKRTVTLVALFIFLVFILFSGKLSVKKSLALMLIVICCLFLYMVGTFDRLEEIIRVLFSFNTSSYGTVSERLNEMNSIVFSTNNIYEFFLGKGVGWNFFILDIDGVEVYKNFPHNTLAFTYGLLGVLGVFLYLYVHFKYVFFKKVHSICRENETKFYKLVLTVFFIISMSVLSPFTSVLNALALSYVIKNENYKKN